MRTRWVSVVLVAAVVVGALAASAPAAKLAGKSVKLGAIYSITGKGAEWGEHSKIATEIAVEESTRRVAWVEFPSRSRFRTPAPRWRRPSRWPAS